VHLSYAHQINKYRRPQVKIEGIPAKSQFSSGSSTESPAGLAGKMRKAKGMRGNKKKRRLPISPYLFRLDSSFISDRRAY
jgi:hypothetical protein